MIHVKVSAAVYPTENPEKVTQSSFIPFYRHNTRKEGY